LIQRYSRNDKKLKLPNWIQQGMKEAHSNVSSDMALSIAKKFFRNMAQPLDQSEQLGTSLWSGEDLEKMNK
jgi:DNA excision repair protein ERCC-2